MISYRVKILEKRIDGVLTKIETKEAFTYGTEPHKGDTFFFSGSYKMNDIQVGEKLILRADFIPPNERKDNTKIEMKIAEILPNRFEPLKTDLGTTIFGISLLFLILFFAILWKLFKKNSRSLNKDR